MRVVGMKFKISIQTACVVAALSLSIGAAQNIQAATVPPQKGLFDTVETQHKGLKPFPKWQNVIDTLRAKPGGCQDGKLNGCTFGKWKEFVDSLRGQKPEKQLASVNRYVNRFRYKLDPVNWGKKDYWAKPEEFFKRFGDCEDYSIVKYYSLRALGWDPKQMRIVVVRDMNLRLAHAILTVRHNGLDLILDNQIGLVVDSTRIRHYKPIYSLSEGKWWRHRMAKK